MVLDRMKLYTATFLNLKQMILQHSVLENRRKPFLLTKLVTNFNAPFENLIFENFRKIDFSPLDSRFEDCPENNFLNPMRKFRSLKIQFNRKH